MKKYLFLALILLCSMSFDAKAIWEREYGVEAYGSLCLGPEAHNSYGIAGVTGRHILPSVFVGVGTGLRYTDELRRIETDADGVSQNIYGAGIYMPIFMRTRFGRNHAGSIRPFATMDMGWSVGAEKANVKGFFFEPQIGLDITPNVYVTIGVDNRHFLRRSLVTIRDAVDLVTRTEETVNKKLASGISLHLGYSF